MIQTARWSIFVLRQFGRVVRPLIAVALTYYVLRRADPSAVLESAAAADLRWIAAAVALVIIDRGLMAYRWVALLGTSAVAHRPPLTTLFRIFFVSTFVGTFLPASIGGDAARAYSLARHGVAAGPAVASVLMDRLLGVVSILLMGVVGLLMSQSGGLAATRAIEVSLLVASVVCLAAMLIVFSERAARLARNASTRLPFASLRRLGSALTDAIRAYAAHHRVLSGVLLGSIAVQLLRITQAYCLGLSLHIASPFSVYVEFIPLILLVMLLPLSINGIGPSQAAFVWFFANAGVSEPDAFALSVLFVALGVVGNLPGGLLYAFGRNEGLLTRAR